MRRMFDSQSSVWLKVASAYQIAHFWAYRKRKFWVNLNLLAKVASRREKTIQNLQQF